MILICMHLKLVSSDAIDYMNFLVESLAHYFVPFFLLIYLPESLNYMDHIDFKIVIVLIVMLKMVGFIPKS